MGGEGRPRDAASAIGGNGLTLPLKTDAGGMFADFNETIRYRPRDGRPRTIVAVVDRNPPAPIDGAPNGVRASMMIEALNDEFSGIGSREVDTGGDRVEIAPRIGLPIREYRLVSVESTDDGTVRIGVN